MRCSRGIKDLFIVNREVFRGDTICTRNLGCGCSRAVESHLTALGYWGDDSKRQRHACILTPSAYILHEETSLTATARTVYSAVVELEAKLGGIAGQRHVDHIDAFGFCAWPKSCFQRTYGRVKHVGGAIPPIIKIDMVRRPCRCVLFGRSRHIQPARALGTIAPVGFSD